MTINESDIETLLKDRANDIIIDEKGITVRDNSEILKSTQDWLKAIYGVDLTFESSDVAGQTAIYIAYSRIADVNLALQMSNELDPATSSGLYLDRIIANNNLPPRIQDSFSQVVITITTDIDNILLRGLDNEYSNEDATAFGCSDDKGNIWYLLKTITIPTKGNTDLIFRSQKIGNIQAVSNSITNIIDPVNGVTKCNNSNPIFIEGESEETDSELRKRVSDFYRQAPSLINIITEVEKIEKLNTMKIFNNQTDSVNAIGMLPHSVWLIIEGGSEDDIIQALAVSVPAGIQTNGKNEKDYFYEGINIGTFRYDRSDKINYFINIITDIPFKDNEIKELSLNIENNLSYDIGSDVTKAPIFNIISAFINDNNYIQRLLDVKIGLSDTQIDSDILKSKSPKDRFITSTDKIFNNK